MGGIVLACFIINLYVGRRHLLQLHCLLRTHPAGVRLELHSDFPLPAQPSRARMGIFAPIVGFLVDRFGSRKLLLGGSLIIGMGLVFLSFTYSLLMFYFAFLFIAFGAGGCTSVVTMTAVAVWFRKNVGWRSASWLQDLGPGD